MDQPTTRRTSLLRLGYFIVLAAILVAGGAAWYFWESRPTVRSVENMVNKEGPPVGSTKPEVETWLDARQILNHRMGLGATGGYPAGRSPSEFCDLSGLEDAECVVGQIPYQGALPEGNGQIWVYFFFDKAGRLMKHVVHRWEGYS
jgi:hypothetical protein